MGLFGGLGHLVGGLFGQHPAMQGAFGTMPSADELMGGAQVPQMQQMPMQAPQQHGPRFSEPGGWGDRLVDIGAILQDDPTIWNTREQLNAARQKEAQQQEAAQQRQQSLGQALRAHGLSLEDALAIASDPNAAASFLSKANEPDDQPNEAKLFKWYQTLSPEQQSAYDQFHPITSMGQYGVQVIPHSAIRQALGADGAPDTIPADVFATGHPVGGQTPHPSGGFRRLP